jgi:type IV pilus assembly protein PilE
MYTFKRSSGFTLIELMITVAIIGILAGVAYPSYTSYVIRAKQGDGKAGLLKLQQAQEKYRANCSQYATGIAATYSCTGGTYNLIGSTTSPDGLYTLAITAGNATSYTLTATPTFTDAGCNVLGINQAGTKTVTGSGSVADCWDR